MELLSGLIGVGLSSTPVKPQPDFPVSALIYLLEMWQSFGEDAGGAFFNNKKAVRDEELAAVDMVEDREGDVGAIGRIGKDQIKTTWCQLPQSALRQPLGQVMVDHHEAALLT